MIGQSSLLELNHNPIQMWNLVWGSRGRWILKTSTTVVSTPTQQNMDDGKTSPRYIWALDIDPSSLYFRAPCHIGKVLAFHRTHVYDVANTIKSNIGLVTICINIVKVLFAKNVYL